MNEDREYLAEILWDIFLKSRQTEHAQMGRQEAPVSIILHSSDHSSSVVLPVRKIVLKNQSWTLRLLARVVSVDFPLLDKSKKSLG